MVTVEAIETSRGKLRIVSRIGDRFEDRVEAGLFLSHELRDLRGQRAVVLGIPRGGVVIAWELARALEADLDVILARKLRTPGQRELAMGSVIALRVDSDVATF